MGLLLMQYEFQKAKQKCNVLELRGIRLADKQELYTKRISNIEKLFSKKKTNLESVWNQRVNYINSQMQQGRASVDAFNSVLAGLGGMGFNLGGQISETTILGDKFNGTDTARQSAIASGLSAAVSQLQTIVQSAMEAMKQAQLEELEAMEDRQREPIAEKDAEIQADVAENDTLLELAKNRMEAAKGRLPETVKGSVAHYGLSG